MKACAGVARVTRSDDQLLAREVFVELCSRDARDGLAVFCCWLAEDVEIEPVDVGRSDAAPGEVTWVVLADPEGNEFCVLAGLDQPHAGGT
jgi:hypothetical protein